MGGSFCAQACSRGGVWGSFAVVFVKKETGAAFGWREIGGIRKSLRKEILENHSGDPAEDNQGNIEVDERGNHTVPDVIVLSIRIESCGRSKR